MFPLFPHLFAMKWWDQMPWSLFSECWALSQLFHSPLSLSSKGSLALLHFLPSGWCHLHIWGFWYFSWQSWFQLAIHPAQHLGAENHKVLNQGICGLWRGMMNPETRDRLRDERSCWERRADAQENEQMREVSSHHPGQTPSSVCWWNVVP